MFGIILIGSVFFVAGIVFELRARSSKMIQFAHVFVIVGALFIVMTLDGMLEISTRIARSVGAFPQLVWEVLVNITGLLILDMVRRLVLGKKRFSDLFSPRMDKEPE